VHASRCRTPVQVARRGALLAELLA
jgi:hypothetical protein